MAPSPIEESQMLPETIVKKIEEIGRCIMWMIFLASGESYRFPELLILKYGGNDRNIFIDSQSRRLDIITGYSKSRAFNLLLKQLDETTSAYVFHYIMVERVMLRLALTEEFAGMHRDIFEGMDEEDRIDVVTSTTDDYVRVPDNLREHSSNVLQSFLFVQPSRGTLVSYDFFSAIFRQFPVMVGQSADSRLNLRQLRQGIVALTRDCIDVSENSPNIMSAKELVAGHSVTVAFQNYGVDSTVGLGDQTLLMSALIVAVCHGWQDWLGVGEVESVIEEVPKLEPLVFQGCVDDLELAGRELYGRKFAFRDGQQFIMNEIYNSSRKLIPVQVLPGYGKTALFQLPLLAMKRRCQKKRIVFVLVPYITLMGDMFQRLNKGGLNVQYATNVSRMNENDITADVYVTCFESARDDHFMELFSNWPYRFRNVHLGYLVVDEFHNVGYQDYRKEVTQGFRHLDVSNFAKVVMLSGTIGKGRFGLHLKAIGITAEPTEQVEDSDKVRIFDAVKEIPLRKVVKTVIAVDSLGVAEEKTIWLVKRFMELVPNEKIIIVCSRITSVEKLGWLIYAGHTPVFVHGSMSSKEKISRFAEFSENPEKRLLIGTKLISEGIDIANLGCIVMCNFVPSLTGLIQTARRLRRGGNCFIFWSSCDDDKDDFPRYLPDVVINSQLAAYYGCSGSTEDHPMPVYEGRCDKLLSSGPTSTPVVAEEELSMGDDSLFAYCESLGGEGGVSTDSDSFT
ncbi:Y' element ATP-dependent helicase protein 1 copy 4 [Maudiozyma humilis]|uniref:DNA 3'-5' helicase n=1 Tax=Maudiozyma humilis TaxID=51915 RepID=A0AAV5S4X8_MAUHU|nr:Y' element ATP-dependent helicase protein 1 copy 4 [Kazachstania humilis]